MDSSKCSVCLEPLYENLRATTCGHVFHAACIGQIVFGDTNLRKCPNCRGRLKEECIEVQLHPKRNCRDLARQIQTLPRGTSAAAALTLYRLQQAAPGLTEKLNRLRKDQALVVPQIERAQQDKAQLTLRLMTQQTEVAELQAELRPLVTNVQKRKIDLKAAEAQLTQVQHLVSASRSLKRLAAEIDSMPSNPDASSDALNVLLGRMHKGTGDNETLRGFIYDSVMQLLLLKYEGLQSHQYGEEHELENSAIEVLEQQVARKREKVEVLRQRALLLQRQLLAESRGSAEPVSSRSTTEPTRTTSSRLKRKR